MSDIPLSDLVTIFLAVFVLIGLQPTLQKGARKLSRLLEQAAARKDRVAPAEKDVHAAIFTNDFSAHALNDFELIVLQRLARFGSKAVSMNQINETLLFGDAVFKKTLWSLHRRGLVSLRVSKMMGPRFMLSESGRRYAREHGYLVEVHERGQLAG